MKKKIREKMRINFKKKSFVKVVFLMILVFCTTSASLSQEAKQDRDSVYLGLDVSSPGIEYREKAAPKDSGIFSIKFRSSYFIPSEQSFKDIYSGGLAVGGEINIKLLKFLDLWLIGNYYSKKGNLPFTEEETKMTLIPLGAGLRLRFHEGIINPYLCIGPVVCIFKETNPIGVAEGTGVGIIGQAGCFFKIIGGLLLDLSVNYSYCTVKPQKIKADVGGIQAGIGLGYEF